MCLSVTNFNTYMDVNKRTVLLGYTLDYTNFSGDRLEVRKIESPMLINK